MKPKPRTACDCDCLYDPSHLPPTDSTLQQQQRLQDPVTYSQPSKMTTTTPTKMATTDTTSQNSEHLPLLSAAQPRPQNSSTNTHQEEDDEEEGDLDRDFPPISPLPTPPKKPTITTTTNNKVAPSSQTTTEHQFASAVKENRRQDVPKPLTPPAPGLTPISVGPAASRNPPERPQNERLNRVFREVARREVQGKEDGGGDGEGV